MTTASGDLTAKQLDQVRQFAPTHLKVVQQIQRQARRAKRDAAMASEPEADDGAFVIDLSNLMERLTAGDLGDIEDAIGGGVAAFDVLATLGSNVKGVIAVIWVMRRKEDPEFTYESARALPVTMLMKVMARVTMSEDTAADPLDNSELPSA